MSEDILLHRLNGNQGDIGEIILNRPSALNALTKSMCQKIHDQLENWQQDDGIKAVIIRSSGGQAFCAGGDLRFLYENKDDVARSLDFFREEYSMNLAIHEFSKPYIAFLDGITMGGGAGISMNGSHRIATERFEFAMPETGIGFFPDVGSGCFLNKCPGRSGHYLGLTGEKINASDALMLSLVGYYVSSDQIDRIIAALCDKPFKSDDMNTVSQVINQFSLPLPESSLGSVGHLINDCFNRDSVEAIFDALDVVSSPWADHTLRTLMKRSPLSLKVALHYLQTAKSKPFKEIIEMELNIALEFTEHHDFYEGIRAQLIDKDRNPQWHPEKITDISDKEVAKFFTHSVNLEV